MELRDIISEMLIKAGMNPKLHGFWYWKHAIECEASGHKMSMRELYTEIAQDKDALNWTSVEGAMRHALKKALKEEKTDICTWCYVGQNGNVSNQTFLAFSGIEAKKRFMDFQKKQQIKNAPPPTYIMI